MAKYTVAIPIIRRNEGGFLMDKDGMTYAGLCEKDNPDFAGWPIVKAHLPLKRGALINDPVLDGMIDVFYKNTRWCSIQGDAIVDDAFAAYLLDWYVNSQGKSIEKLQEILDVQMTCHLGRITLNRLNQELKEDASGFLLKYHERRKQYYRDHVDAVPADAKNLKGWLDRCDNTIRQVDNLIIRQ